MTLIGSFLDVEMARLQLESISDSGEQQNFLGFCLLRSLRHAIDTKLHGAQFAGEMPDGSFLEMAFFAAPMRSTATTTH